MAINYRTNYTVSELLKLPNVGTLKGENDSMPNPNSWTAKLTLLLASSLTVMSGATVSPSLPAMKQHFERGVIKSESFCQRMDGSCDA
jgi:hypothetical protein